MTLSEFFDQVNSAYRGSDDNVPATGTADYTLWVQTTNRKINEWVTDGKNTWESLFEVRDLGTITAGTQSYDLDDDVLLPSDDVVVTTLENGTVTCPLVKAQERGRVAGSCYISGRDPQVLTFHDPITSDSSLIGGKISLGAYFVPDAVANQNDVIPVDNPYWLVYAVASELAFNDLTYESKVPDLDGKANNLYHTMVSNNRRGGNNSPRVVRVKTQRIHGATR